MRRFWPALRIDQYLALSIIVAMVVLRPSPITAGIRADMSSSPMESQSLALISPQPVPIFNDLDPTTRQPMLLTNPEAYQERLRASQQKVLDSLTARAVYVADDASGSVLLEKDAYTPLPPASTTKLMTALIARDLYYPQQVMTVREEAFSQGNVMELQPGEAISVEALLSGLLINSANDAAFVLANNHPGGYDGFVADMNMRAAKLQLHNSHFTNPSGLDDASHLMSARDLAIIFREVVKNDYLRDLTGQSAKSVTDVTGAIRHPLYHTHELIWNDGSVIGGKTGTTLLAGQVLVTQFNKNGHTITVVIMNSQDRYQESVRIIDWVSEHYTWLTPEQVDLID